MVIKAETKIDCCNTFAEELGYKTYKEMMEELGSGYSEKCRSCKGKGYKELSGPTFSSALIIMDRRGL